VVELLALPLGDSTETRTIGGLLSLVAVTYAPAAQCHILDGQFARFLQHYRPLLPGWFLEAAHAALRVSEFG
jgi:hypothetical protein